MMEDFDVVKNILVCCTTVICIISTCFVSFKLSVKNKTVPVRLSEFADIFMLISNWFGTFELLPSAGRCGHGMK